MNKGKYYLILVEANKYIANIDRRKFGKEEKLSGKLRQFHWMDSNRFTSGGTPFNDRIWQMRKYISDFFQH